MGTASPSTLHGLPLGKGPFPPSLSPGAAVCVSFPPSDQELLSVCPSLL